MAVKRESTVETLDHQPKHAPLFYQKKEIKCLKGRLIKYFFIQSFQALNLLLVSGYKKKLSLGTQIFLPQKSMKINYFVNKNVKTLSGNCSMA